MELIGHGTDSKPTGDENSEVKPFDQIKKQIYSTQNVDRIYRISSTSFILIQLTSSVKSDRLWPLSEQVRKFISIIFKIFSLNLDFEKIRFIKHSCFKSGLHHSITFNYGLCDYSR